MQQVRFAPSPTGLLHLGHVYSALYAWHACGKSPKHFHLRIDDLDHTRCRDHFIDAHITDLQWLGISWANTPLRQSNRLNRYQQALKSLQERNLIYPCFLSRKELNEILSAPQETGTLKTALPDDEKTKREAQGNQPAWRLDIERIKKDLPELHWHDQQKGTQIIDIEMMADVVIARRDIGASYHLSVVLDDYDSGITLVTRGHDLFDQTAIHRLLQHLLDLPTPLYDHHPLITDEAGKRLAKRDDARSLAHYRETGLTRDDILAMLPF